MSGLPTVATQASTTLTAHLSGICIIFKCYGIKDEEGEEVLLLSVKTLTKTFTVKIPHCLFYRCYCYVIVQQVSSHMCETVLLPPLCNECLSKTQHDRGDANSNSSAIFDKFICTHQLMLAKNIITSDFSLLVEFTVFVLLLLSLAVCPQGKVCSWSLCQSWPFSSSCVSEVCPAVLLGKHTGE